ncbi:hypothetical protein [uncultured Bacteroides sp.]|uniref:hypothetical protein n=1 Tax=uncultured Bacteroides sp. TaxID=162156 RepID=UPI00262AC1AB|nr:hypothetical protein [uncultured Bacteroides sp.]
MEHSELFIMFPSYEEVEEKPHYINSVGVMSMEDICKIVDYLDEIIHFFQNENYDGYYDGKNIQAFLYPLEIAEDCYPNMKTRFRVMMKQWGENWRNDRKQSDTEKYYYYHMEIEDDTLCELTKRKKDSADGSTFLLINQEAFFCHEDRIKTKCEDEDFEIEVRKAEIKAIARWFEINRTPQRSFHLNPKHGELGKGAHPSNKGEKVSVLMCSRGEACNLLKKAIGEDLKILYFYDTNYNQYIEFKRESDNVYHAFHLDKEDEQRIPNNIKESIKKLFQ